uniref:Uncharacterized protein n=1 Tax=Anguilla anguilla TaxID=7936 RepID=A0A0E9UMB8_ANGAN
MMRGRTENQQCCWPPGSHLSAPG